MSFDTFGEFLAMDGHGLYVWLSYGAATIVVLANVISVRMARARFFRAAIARVQRAATAKAQSAMNADADRAEPGT